MSTASYGRSRSGDRFYNPPPVRRQLLLQQQQQQQQLLLQKQKQEREEIRAEKLHQRRQKSSVSKPKSSESRTESDDCTSTATVASNSTSVSNLTNLDRFLEFTTPLVTAQYFSKTSIKGWRNQEDEFRPYFVLEDLWESFKEWSAYGAGVPLVLNGSDSVKQYYVPYLSGIQLYIDPAKPSPRTRRPGGESDESCRETSSDGSSDYETDRRASYFGGPIPTHVGSTIQGMKGLSIQNKPLNGSSSDEGESSDSRGVLVFEYFEYDPPYHREPLADKVLLLASRFPELKTYRSCDLTPSSWISVAWYPIYRIPTGPTLQNLDSCFLTFHSLSTPNRDSQDEWCPRYGSCPTRDAPHGFDVASKLALPVFGMASYKFKISVWDQNGVDECPKANALLQAADEWIRILNINHPDYRFFISHNYPLR